jgi:hypothetical protein
VKRVAKQKRKVVLGAPDGRITPRAGLHLVAKLDKLLGITATINDAGPLFKRPKRGLMLGGGGVPCRDDARRWGLPLRPRPRAQ